MIELKGRFWVILLLLLLAVAVIAVAWSSASQQPNAVNSSPTPIPINTPAVLPTPIVTVTVNSEVGVKQVTITNLNTGTSITKRSTDLPFSFNADNGDSLRFYVITEENYMWNAWMFKTGTFDNHNPLTLKATSNIDMSPQCLVQEAPPE